MKRDFDFNPPGTVTGYGGRIRQLDGLRGIAVSLVLIFHFGGSLADRFEWGLAGVHLFFVLSGFLITGILLRERAKIKCKSASKIGVLKRFYIKRSMRILPIYFLVIICGIVSNLPDVRHDWPWLVSFTGNFRTAYTGHFLGWLAPTWTLNIEEQFYLAWPFLILSVSPKTLRKTLPGLIMLGPIWRAATTLLAVPDRTMLVLPFAAFDSIGLGALLAVLWQDHPERRGSVTPLLAWVGVALIVQGSFFGPAFVRAVSFTLGVALLAVWLIDRSGRGFTGLPGKLLSSSPLVYIGVVSYGIYLYHLPTLWAVTRLFAHFGASLDQLHPVLQFGLLALISIGIAAASWELLEKRLIALGSSLADRYVKISKPQALRD